ncbi:hypothetical protein K438DRAFT_1863896 [Mycena galopus ATCC 62051]|nr:hypothetical protein K438DRAFT_1863896 [Mycena galopus ATCC 62051]
MQFCQRCCPQFRSTTSIDSMSPPSPLILSSTDNRVGYQKFCDTRVPRLDLPLGLNASKTYRIPCRNVPRVDRGVSGRVIEAPAVTLHKRLTRRFSLPSPSHSFDFHISFGGSTELGNPLTCLLAPRPCVYQPEACVIIQADTTLSPAPSFMSVDSAAQQPNNTGGEVGVKESPKPAAPSLSTQQQAQLAALLNFKPSSRDVISGIAPHIFDDQRPTRRSRSRRRRHTSSPECRRRSMSPAPHRSPLRLSAVISVDDHGVIEHKGEGSVVLELYTAPTLPLTPAVTATPIPIPIVSPSQIISNTKSKRCGFRIDRVLKTLVLRLK